MKTTECAKCGINFGITETYDRNRRDDHSDFYCPNGHVNYFPGESDAEKYKRLMESAQGTANNLREGFLAADRARENAEKKLKNLKKRTAAGVCPCCNRTVSQLQRHMQSKHQEFLQLSGLAPVKQLLEKV